MTKMRDGDDNDDNKEREHVHVFDRDITPIGHGQAKRRVYQCECGATTS